MKPTINQVIQDLEDIIQHCEKTHSPLGYFAALYQGVTKKVKEEIANNFFENGARMEELDVVFAKRYIDAFYAYQNNEPVTQSWQIAFDLSKNYWPIVLQHLLIGMNAHINLDLGIAAAEISKGKSIDDLETDFYKINEILSSLVNEVQEELSNIWPTLKRILQHTRKIDDFLVDFSMELARDGAWRFACTLAESGEEEWDALIDSRDAKVTKKGRLVTDPAWLVGSAFKIVRLGERGGIDDRIALLRKEDGSLSRS